LDAALCNCKEKGWNVLYKNEVANSNQSSMGNENLVLTKILKLKTIPLHTHFIWRMLHGSSYEIISFIKGMGSSYTTPTLLNSMRYLLQKTKPRVLSQDPKQKIAQK
jgi:hypothetical protein